MTSNKQVLSFSAIECFKTCNRKYYYRYIVKLATKFWPWLILGNLVHLVLEKFYKYILYFSKRGRQYDKKELIKRAYISAIKKYHRLSKSKRHPAITDKQKEDCQKIIKKYLKRSEINDPRVAFVEKEFYIDIEDGLSVKGYIDRIDKIDENLYHVLDYKTSKEPYDVNKNFQLTLYSIALKRIVNNRSIKIKKILDFVKFEKEQSSDFHNDADEDRVFSEIKCVASQINMLKQKEKSDEWKATENSFCWCCDFAYQCKNDISKNKQILNKS